MVTARDVTSSKLITKLRRRLAGSESEILFLTLYSVTLVVPGVMVPYISRLFVDEVLLAGRTNWMGPLIAGLAAIALIQAALTWTHRHFLLRLKQRLLLASAGAYMRHLLRLPLDFFIRRYGGEIGNRNYNNSAIAEFLSTQLAVASFAFITMLFYSAVMFQYSVTLTWVGIVAALLQFVLLRMLSRRRLDSLRRARIGYGDHLAAAMATVQSIESVKAQGMESRLLAHMAARNAAYVSAQQAAGSTTHLIAAGTGGVRQLATVVVLALGGLQIVSGELTIGALVAFQSLLSGFLQPAEELVQVGLAVQDITVELERLDVALAEAPDPVLARYAPEARDNSAPSIITVPKAPPERETAHRSIAGRIELRGVTFGYAADAPPVITGLNLEIPAGARIGLVGPPGSGKSTVLKLIAGLYVPWSGEILIDGVPRERYTRSSLGRSVVYLQQTPHFMAGTLWENLTQWDPDVSLEEVVRAAKIAGMHELISRRPGGYETWIDIEGRNFSLGERQRIQLAQALVYRPAVLLVDEAFTALDALARRHVEAQLRELGCTCIVVSDRLHPAGWVDEIIRLEPGRPPRAMAGDRLIEGTSEWIGGGA